jgi:transposase
VGKNPTDRGKIGTKRSLLTEGGGVPIGLAVEGANRNDFKMARATIESLTVERPEPTPDTPQGMCLDKGYDYDEVRDLLAEFGFTAHIRARGEEAQAIKQDAGYKARRWVVEMCQPQCCCTHFAEDSPAPSWVSFTEMLRVRSGAVRWHERRRPATGGGCQHPPAGRAAV